MIIETAFACIFCFKRNISVYRVYRNICARGKPWTVAAQPACFTS